MGIERGVGANGFTARKDGALVKTELFEEILDPGMADVALGVGILKPDFVAVSLALFAAPTQVAYDLFGVKAKRRAPSKPDQATPGTIRLLNAMANVPTVVMGRRNEVLAWNPLGHLLVAGHTDFDAPTHVFDRPNLTRMLFLDPHTKDLYRVWRDEASLAVASLRFIAAQHQDDAELTQLIGELTLKSPDFAAMWTKHPVQQCVSGLKRFHHPEVGDLDLSFEVLHLPGASGHRMITHAAEPGSTDAAALELLSASNETPVARRVPSRI